MVRVAVVIAILHPKNLNQIFGYSFVTLVNIDIHLVKHFG